MRHRRKILGGLAWWRILVRMVDGALPPAGPQAMPPSMVAQMAAFRLTSPAGSDGDQVTTQREENQ
jgi:hypothetical protein